MILPKTRIIILSLALTIVCFAKAYGQHIYPQEADRYTKSIPGITGGAIGSHEGQPGPIMLQGSENGRIEYRNIVLTPAR
jgi:hypothetical protein